MKKEISLETNYALVSRFKQIKTKNIGNRNLNSTAQYLLLNIFEGQIKYYVPTN
jgi:hypothetical protein